MVLRNVAKSYSLEEQRQEINLIAADLHALTGVVGQPETDPVFTSSDAYNITQAEINSWNLTVSYGDHRSFGYATLADISNANNWNAAYGWGNHASVGYLTSVALNDLSDVDTTGATTGQAIIWDAPSSTWKPGTVATSGGGIELTDISVTTLSNGNASLIYDNNSGVFSFTPPDLSGFSTFSGSYTDLTNKPTLFSGSYNDLSDKPTFAVSDLTDVNTISPSVGQILKWDGTQWSPAADLTASGNSGIGLTDLSVNLLTSGISNLAYDNSTGVFSFTPPDLSGYSTFSGSYNDLTDLPTLFSGNYTDLTNKPTIFSGSWNDLTDKPTLFSGSYNDLSDKPTIPTPFSGSWNDLTDKPVLFSGSYNDLNNKPNIPSSLNDLIDVLISGTPNDGAILKYNATNSRWELGVDQQGSGGSGGGGGGNVAMGSIMMWSGSIADIPTGWQLCDGTNGTPDLRDRFVIGAGSNDYAVGTTGGYTDTTLPSHAHNWSGNTTANGNTNSQDLSHSHNVSGSGGTNNTGAHTHGWGANTFNGALGNAFESLDNPQNNAGGNKTANTNSQGNHSHNVSITGSTNNVLGNHSHNVSVDVSLSGNTSTQGESVVGTNLPPYYALCFIYCTSGSTGSGSSNYIELDDLSVNVTASGTADLSYNNSTGLFTYTPPDLSGYLTSYTVTASDLNSISIDALSDVDTTTTAPATNDVLTWDGSKWAPAAPTGGSGSTNSGEIVVQDEGNPLSTPATTINFVGAGVVASGTGSTKTITISGGTSGSGGSSTFIGLTDTPSTFTSDKWIKVNSAGDGIEFVDAPSSSSSSGGGECTSVYTYIGLEGWTNTHNAPILFTQALDDDTGGIINDPVTGSGRQINWLRDYVKDIKANAANAEVTHTEVANGGHNAFTTDATLQTAIRNAVGSSAGSGTINNAQFPIVPTDGETHTINGTSYPVMGKLYVPVGLTDNQIDVVVVFHGTLTEGGNSTIGQAASDMLDRFVNTNTTNLNIRDKIIFSVAYPQDHIPQNRQFNLTGVGTEQADFLMGDNLPYARAAVGWVKNSLNAYIAAQGGSKTIKDVYLFGHSQGGKLVSKINTLETGIAGVIANAPGPIQFDQTCTAVPGGTSCSKVSAIYGTPEENCPSSSSGGSGIALTDLSVTVNSAGTAGLTYNNTTGVFSYTPPDLSSYATTNALSTATQNANNWNAAYSWGNHATAGYLKSYTETQTLDNVLELGNTTSRDINTTGRIYYGNVFTNLSDLPSATSYHGMFAHVHATGKGYFAHAGSWVPLANDSQLANVSDWDAAFSWGNHALEGYLGSSTVLSDLADVSFISASDGDVLTYNSTSNTWTSQAPGASGIVEVIAGTGLEGGGSVSSEIDTVTLDISNTGVTGGTYANPDSITVNNQGQITAITAGSAPADAIPPGVIVMWSGSTSNVPSGWVLCDGTTYNTDGSAVNVPDLRGMFIVGSGGDYTTGDTGGQESVTLSVNELPSHSHTVDSHQHNIGSHTHNVGNHSHNVSGSGSSSTVGAGGHTHTYDAYGDGGSNWRPGITFEAGGGVSYNTGSVGDHSHNFSVSISGSTNDTGPGQTGNASGASGDASPGTNSIGGSVGHENRPPYYALAYIYKLP